MGYLKSMIRKNRWAFGGAVILLFSTILVIGAYSVANAQEGTPADREYEISYTQGELASLLRKAFEEEKTFDFARLKELSESLVAETGVFEEWLTEVLDGLVPVGDIIEERDYFGFLAMDVEARELHFIAFNQSEDSLGFDFAVVDKELTPARSEVYAFAADGEPIKKDGPKAPEVETTEAETEEEETDAEEETDIDESAGTEDTDSDDTEEEEDLSNENEAEEDSDSEDADNNSEDDSEDTDSDDDNSADEADDDNNTSDNDSNASDDVAAEDASPEIFMKVAPRSFSSILIDEDIDIEESPASETESERDDEEETEDESEDDEEIESETEVIEEDDDEEEDDKELPEDYEVELQRRFSNAKAEGSYKMVLKEGEFGRVILYTGLLNGGTIDSQGDVQMEIPAEESDEESDEEIPAAIQRTAAFMNTIDDLGLATGPATAGSRNILKIYSKADGGELGIDTESDFVVYSKFPSNYYSINEESVINVTGTSSGNRNFYIELHNSQPVTVKQYNLTGGSISTNTSTSVSVAEEGAVLRFQNEDDIAFYWSGALTLEGKATIEAHSDVDYAMKGKVYNTVTLNKGFVLSLSGKDGIDMASSATSDLTLSDKSSLYIQNLDTSADGHIMNIGGAVKITNSTLHIEDVNANGKSPINFDGALDITSNSKLSLKQIHSTSENVLLTSKALTITSSALSLENITTENSSQVINVAAAKINSGSVVLESVAANGSGNLITTAALQAKTNSSIRLSDVTVNGAGQGIYANGTLTVDNSDIVVDNIILSNGDLLQSTKAATLTAAGFTLQNVEVNGKILSTLALTAKNNSTMQLSEVTVKGDNSGVYAAGDFIAENLNIAAEKVSMNNGSLIQSTGTAALTDIDFAVKDSAIAGRIMTTGAVTAKNSTLKLLNLNLAGSDYGLYADGTLSMENTTIEADKVDLPGGNLINSTSRLTLQTFALQVTNSSVSGKVLNTETSVVIKTSKFEMRDNVIGEYALYFKNGVSSSTTNMQISDSEFLIDMGDSTGGAIYHGTANIPKLINTTMKLAGNGNTNPLLDINTTIHLGNSTSAKSSVEIVLGENSIGGGMRTGDLYLYQDSSIVVDDKGQGGKNLDVQGLLQMNNTSRIVIKQSGESADDGISISGAATLNNNSNITVDSESTMSRNMYVDGALTLNNNSWMKHTSNLVGKAGDVGGAEGAGDVSETSNIDEGSNSDNNESQDEVVANAELDIYLADTQAVLFVKGNVILSTAGNFIEIYGNADMQSKEAEGTPYGLITHGAESQVMNGAYIRIDNVRVGLLAKTIRLQNTLKAGSKNYDSVESIMTNTNKSRVYARGTYVGAICTNYFRVLDSSNFYAEGGSAGIMARRTSRIRHTDGLRKGTTVIALGMNPGSSGFIVTEDMRFYGNMRVIAEGDANGVLLTQKSSRLLVANASQLVAVGRSENSSGVYSENANGKKGTVRSSEGSYLYAIGGMNGIYAVNTNINSVGKSSNQSTMIGIGGVPDESLSHTLESMDYLNNVFDMDSLPFPALAEGNRGEKIDSEDEIQVPGVVKNGADGSRGIVTGGDREPWIKAENYSTMIGIGGEYGIANTGIALDDIDSDNGGQIWAQYGKIAGHGGKIGIWSTTRVRTTNIGSLWGYGEEYGVYAATTLRSYGGGSSKHGYMYGIGKINGLFSEKGYESYNYGHIIGETWIDLTASADEAMGNPAVKAWNTNQSMYLRADSLLHEVYNTIGMDIASAEAYQLNVEYDAVGQNMGAQPADIIKYTWTTPEAELSTGNSWMEQIYINDYSAADDQRLLYAGQRMNSEGDLQYGLIATNYQNGTTIVANRKGLDAKNAASGAIYGVSSATHRMTFRNATTFNNGNMMVQIDLKESLNNNRFDVNNVPEGLSFELEFTPYFTEGYDENEFPLTISVDDSDEYHYDRESGILTFYKLREGEYVFRQFSHYWPYKEISEIPFVVVIDTKSDANGPGGNVSNWASSKWVETVYVGYYKEQANGTRKWVDLDSSIASVPKASTQLTASDPNSTPSFAIPSGPAGAAPEETYEYLFNKPSSYKGIIEVYYQRLEYEVDLRAVDSENFESLGSGAFKYTGYIDNTVVVSSKTVTAANGNYGAAYPQQTMYAGIVYRIQQTATQTNHFGYSYDSKAHDLRLMYDADSETHYIEDVGSPNFRAQYYSFATEDEEIIYHIWAKNDWKGNSLDFTINLVDFDSFKDGITYHLENGDFELYTKNFNGIGFHKDESLVSNGNGTFKFTARQGSEYRLYQTATNPGYKIHDGYYCFRFGNATVMTFVVGPHEVQLIDGESGWAAPSPGGNNVAWHEPIYITNSTNQGSLSVEINAKGIWTGHDDAIFTVEFRNAESADYNQVIYRNIVIPGSTDFDNFRNITSTEKVTFDGIPRGEYEVTVYSSLRTGSGEAQTKVGSAGRIGNGNTISFNFVNQSESLLTGSDSMSHSYKIQFE